jgi:hypothetical protein
MKNRICFPAGRISDFLRVAGTPGIARRDV